MMPLLTLPMMMVLLSFLLKLTSHHLYTFTFPLQQKLKQNHRAFAQLLLCSKQVKFTSIQMAYRNVIAWSTMI